MFDEMIEDIDTAKEWKLEEINWQNIAQIQEDDTIRIGKELALVAGWCGDLKGAVTGRVWGRRILLNCGCGKTKVLQVADGLETCFVEA